MVLCMDVDSAKIAELKAGNIPIFEPGLEPIVKSNIEAGTLCFTDALEEAIAFSDLIFIAVGTPPDEDGSADLGHVLTVAANIGKHMENSKTVVTKSTVPVGTSDKVLEHIERELKQRNSELDVTVASNPEFLKEGAAVADFMKPDRIVVGTNSETAKSLLKRLYAPFNRNSDRMLYMDIRSAELTKYAANAMLATKISFINEIANLAEQLGADVEQVRQGIGSDPRIGYQFIYPGCGYGGSCFPKDVRALSQTANEYDCEMRVLNAVNETNIHQKERLFSFIKQYFKGEIVGKRIALWGLAFKPKTDDMRDAPSRVLMESLWAAGASVQAFDPEAMDVAGNLYPGNESLSLMAARDDVLQDADALVICTEWQHFRAPDFDLIKSSLNNPVIFDGRNLYDPVLMEEMGITYYGIGRGESIKR
ncbi:MAG: UDP-glucose 6-dehydrogenase [Pseudohongiella sp.]|nr:MAG: UDP-glucose 6-dehydrogenase [Pseudohongiella sp.]